MPILLTTPYDPGDLEVGVTYDHVDLVGVDFTPQTEAATLSIAYGQLSGTFVEGRTPRLNFRVDNLLGTGYTDFAALLSNNGEGGVAAFHRVSLQWLLDQAHFLGTIV